MYCSKIQLKKIEKIELNDFSERIKNFINIENRNKRNLNENIKLSKYCIDKFGVFWWSVNENVQKINLIYNMLLKFI